jgi:hypothetical protein
MSDFTEGPWQRGPHDYDVMPGGISIVREWGTRCSYSETLTITVPQVATIRFENKE